MITVKEVMTRDVITFREDTPVGQVADTLSERRITGAPVMDSEGYVIGIVSEMDVISKRGRTAADIMSPNVITVGEDTSLQEAAKILGGERIRRLPVLSAGRLVGLLSRSDVLEFFTHSQWTCTNCGDWDRGLVAPERCDRCGQTSFRLERTHPGH